MSQKSQEKSPHYFNFDGGAIEVAGEKAVIKGSTVFDFFHELRSPNWPVIQEIEEECENWLKSYVKESSDFFRFIGPFIKLNSQCFAYITHEKYIKNKDFDNGVTRKKAFWIYVFGLAEWLADTLDDQKTYIYDQNYPAMSTFFGSTICKIFHLEFRTKEELKTHIDEFGLYKDYPEFIDCLYVWFCFATDFYRDLNLSVGMTMEDMATMAQAFEKQYTSHCWMDGVGLEKVDSFYLYASQRMWNSGGMVQITMCSIFEGFNKPELKYIRKDSHIRHFEFLYINTIGFLNDLLSLPKEVKEGSKSNVIFVWMRKDGKMSLQESVNKAMKKHDHLLEKTRELYSFLQNKYKSDPKVLEYLSLVINQFTGICQFMVSISKRYGEIKWSVSQEKADE